MKSLSVISLVLLCLTLLLASTSCGMSEESAESDSKPPSTPANLAKTTPDSDNTPTFTWNAATDDSGVFYYYVSIDGGGTLVSRGDTTTYTLDHALSDGSHTFEVKAVDGEGNAGTAAGLTFIIDTGPIVDDTTSPTISAVMLNRVTSSDATIVWLTDEHATSQVEYGTTSTYGLNTALDTSLVILHSVNLTGLNASTTYHYRVRSKDAANNETVSGDNTFPTDMPPDITTPVISDVASAATSSGATITWSTNEFCTGQVEYGLTTGYGSTTALDNALVNKHSVALTGLASGTAYHFRVKSKDNSSNEAVSGDFSFTTDVPPDMTPPVISGIVSSNITASSAIVSWTTDELATSQVEYGLTSDYGSTTALDAGLVTSHSVSLSELSPNVTYHFRVKSEDSSGNEAVSDDFSLAMPDTMPPTISSVTSSTKANSATITWTTNEPATSQVECGLTTSYGLVTTLDTSLVTSHSVVLTGLTADSTYHFRVISRDASNNVSQSGDSTFKTKKWWQGSDGAQIPSGILGYSDSSQLVEPTYEPYATDLVADTPKNIE